MTSKFKKGSGKYICRMCGKQTRETGNDESNVRLCRNCNDRVLKENELNDETNLSQDEIKMMLDQEFGKL